MKLRDRKMKLRIRYYSGLWYCDLDDDGGYWIGSDKTPLGAYKEYLSLVINHDKREIEHADYDWCKERGLIK